MTALPSPGTTASATGTGHMQYGNSSHLTTTSMQASLIASPRSTSASLLGPSFTISPTIGNSKRKRRPAGTPDPDAEVVALSPKTLMESDRYVCEICSQGFQRDQNLQMHRRKHKVPWKLLKRSSPEVRKRVYVCPDPSCLHHDPCHALGDLVGIKKHYRRKHSCDKQWKCEKCSKGYAVQSDYKAHLKTCGTRGHCCDCGRVFSRVESFIEHQDDCSAAREKTAIASSDQTSLASLSARDGSASPSADTVSVNNRSVGGVVRSLDSTTKYESATWLMDHQELQLLPAKQYMEFSRSSGPGCAVDHEVQDKFLVKEPEAAFVSQSRLVNGSPILVNSSSVAKVSDQDVAPPRLQLSIGLYYEASHETPSIERKEGLSKSDTAPERSDLTPPSLTSYASVTGSQRSSTTTTNNEFVNRRWNFLHPHPTSNETSDLKGQVARKVEAPVHLELGTSQSDVRGSIENNNLVAQARGQEYHVIEDLGTSKPTWTSPRKLTRFEGASEAATPQATHLSEMMIARSDHSWKELSRSQAEVSTSGSAAATTSRMKHAEELGHRCGGEAWITTEMSRNIRGEVASTKGEAQAGREEELRRQAREQLRQACVEKAYADEARESAKTQMEVAEADLRNATRIREHAQAQLLQAYLMQQQATRRIDASRLQITCQACRQKFHTAEVDAAEFLRLTPFQFTLDTSMDAPLRDH